jgi:tRNA (cytosine34-C5)-methyltransferase
VKIVGWKGKISVRAYVPRNDRLHYLRLIGADISSFEINKFKERKQREQEREAAKEADANKLNDKGDIQPEK